MAYATPADYRALPGAPEVPDDAVLQQLLQDASDRLDELTVTATYPVDQYGMPTTAGVAAAFLRATVKQAAHQQLHPDEGDGIAYGAVVLGPLQLPAISGLEARYSAEAVQILRAAGLITGRVLTAMGPDYAPRHYGETYDGAVYGGDI